MSDALAAASQALGVPEELVKRSAEAKAKALGGTADDYIASWGGGAPPPAAPAPPPPPAEESAEAAAPAPVPPPSPPPAESEPEVPGTPAPVTPSAPAPSGPPPILEGRNEHPLRVMAGAVAALLLALFLGLFAPSVPESGSGVYSSAIPLSATGKEGRAIYLSEGCAACHTQMVRPVVADAGLGGVTVSDTNQVLGNRRIGPDLAHVGSRMQGAEMSSLMTFSRAHPSYLYLGSADVDRVVTYLKESK